MQSVFEMGSATLSLVWWPVDEIESTIDIDVHSLVITAHANGPAHLDREGSRALKDGHLISEEPFDPWPQGNAWLPGSANGAHGRQPAILVRVRLMART